MVIFHSYVSLPEGMYFVIAYKNDNFIAVYSLQHAATEASAPGQILRTCQAAMRFWAVRPGREKMPPGKLG